MQPSSSAVAVTTVSREGRAIDRYETRFGIRDVRFEPERGVFVNGERIFIKGKRDFKSLNAEVLKGQRASIDVRQPDTGDVVVKKGRIFTKRAIKRLAAADAPEIPISEENVLGKVLAKAVRNPQGGDLIADINEVIDEEILDKLRQAGVDALKVLFIDGVTSSDAIRKTLLLDKVDSKEDALIEIYRRLRPGMFVTASIKGKEVSQAFVLPRHLVYPGDRVYTVEGNHLKIKSVDILRAFKDSVIVSQGLSDGERIIKTPLSDVTEGMLVRIK